MKTKQCPKCREIKTVEKFSKDKNCKDGLKCWCNDCIKEYHKEYRQKNKEKIREYRKENKEKIREYEKKYRKENQEHFKEYRKKYLQEHRKEGEEWDKKYYQKNKEKLNEQGKKHYQENREYYKEYQKKYLQEHKKERNEYLKNRRRTNPQYKLNANMSGGIRQSLKSGKNGRHWEVFVNYTIKDLMKHIEKQFKEGMNWDNQGDWHLDHKIPIVAFNFNSPEHIDFKRCWALDNLQPLWAKENIQKKDKIKKPFQPSLQIKVDWG